MRTKRLQSPLFRVVAFCLLTSLVSGEFVPFARAEEPADSEKEDPPPPPQKPDPVHQSQGVRFEFKPLGQDPVTVDTQYGAEKEPKETVEHGVKIEGEFGDKTVQVFENEGSPAKLPAELEKAQRERRLTIERIVIPTVMVTGLVFWGRYLKKIYVPPTGRDWVTGVTMGAFRSVITGMVWFAAPGVSFELALSMTAMMTAITTTHAVLGSTYQAGYLHGIKNPESTWGLVKLATRSILYDLATGNFVNWMGGMHLPLGQYNASLLPTLVIGNIHGARRNLLTRGARELNMPYSFITQPIFFTLQALENSGALPTLFSIAFYAVRPSIVATFAVYGGLILANQYRPNCVKALLQKAFKPLDYGINRILDGVNVVRSWMGLKTINYCRNAVRPLKDPSIEVESGRGAPSDVE